MLPLMAERQVTIYMSSQDPAGDYFPRIESITDSFGNTFNGSDPSSRNAFVSTIQTGLGLRVGDTFTFDCVGTDPHGRELEWELHHSNMTQTSTVERARGQQATLVSGRSRTSTCASTRRSCSTS